MVEQFGLAMILSSAVRMSALISGIISFFVGSMRQAEELSTTVVPASANRGAHSSDVSPPAEKIAMSGRMAMACCMPVTLCVLPRNVTSFPMERSLATGISSETGKSLSSNTCNIFLPTRPVAPTTATFIFFCLFDVIKLPSNILLFFHSEWSIPRLSIMSRSSCFSPAR